MGKIVIDDLSIYAYHGCFPEERKIGSEYSLNIWVEGDFSNAEKTDNLSDAVDYVRISDIAAKEMLKPSKLIEHVANRILLQILDEWESVSVAGVIIKKINPPMNVPTNSVQYQLAKSR
tara:strand:+ start:3423 stop:3779 length:357 start_codon:yes stop_codon:yes gene_type:complete